MQRILVSACLLGEPVRYDGNHLFQQNAGLQAWQQQGRLVSFCPEVAGGLDTPRAAAEIVGGDGYDVLAGKARVIDNTGRDVSAAFISGAQQALAICHKEHIQLAILSARSPSCGDGHIHNGQFSRQLKVGSGVTAALLKQNGVTVFNQHTVDSVAPYLNLRISAIQPTGFKAFWPVFQKIVREQQSYALDPAIEYEQAYDYWCQQPQRSLALTFDNKLAGIYYLKPNTAGPGDHICNCGYMIAPEFRGKGLARILCQHSQQLAQQLGYRAMQFNLVVSTNHAAVHLWQTMGFEIIGVIPQAYRHRLLGLVDAYVMHKSLARISHPRRIYRDGL